MGSKSNIRKILITGGCGFIGSNFIKYILRNYNNLDIINLDKLTYAGNIENLKDIENNKKYTFVNGDIKDKHLVTDLIEQSDAIVHFAAESHVDRSIIGAAEFIQTNVYGTYVLLQASLESIKKGNNLKRFIMISTDEVYGDIPIGKSSKETDALMPRNPYAASKAGADRLAYSYHETHQLPIIITRSSNNFGPYQNPEKMIPLFITNLYENKKIPLYGDGKNIRDWLFVEDNCKAIDLILQNGRNGEVYNIGGGNELQNIQITNKILSHMRKDEKYIEYVDDRKGHDRRYSLDFTKIQKELGWKPTHDFDSAFLSTIEWYKRNIKWWKKLK